MHKIKHKIKFEIKTDFKPYVLALCGASGTCKSTAVELICTELKIQLKSWTEDSWDPGSTSGIRENFMDRNSFNSNYSSR